MTLANYLNIRTFTKDSATV